MKLGSRMWSTAGSLTIERITILGASTVTQIFLARTLGSGGLGQLSAVLAASALLMPLAQGGLSGIAVKAAIGHPAQERAVFETALWWRLIAAMIAAAFGIIIWGGGLSADAHYAVFPLLAIAQIALALQVLELRFLAHERTPELVRVRITIALVFAALKIGAAQDTGSIAIVAAVFASEFLVLGAAHAIWCRKVFHDWIWPRAHALWRDWFVTRTPWLVVSGIAEVINQKIDILMLERLRGAHEAGIYAAAAKISEAWYAVPFLLVTAAFPSIARAQDEGRLTQRDWQRLLDAMFVLTLIMSVVIQLLAQPIVHLLFGEQFEMSASVLAIHVWAGLFVGMRAVLSRWIITEDVLWLSTWMACAGAFVNVALNVVLIPTHGAQGAAIATTVSYATAAWLALYFNERSRALGKMMFRSVLLPFRIDDLKSYLRGLRI